MSPPRKYRTRAVGRIVFAAVFALVPALAITTTTFETIGATPPGALPQTKIEPNLAAGLNLQMRRLWHALSLGSDTLAAQVFFPRTAYIRMKTGQIPDPGADYTNRLIGFLDLDVAAYHHALFRNPHVVFERVLASRSDAAWIAPRACENRIGYWHLPGVRFVFTVGGRVESVGVDSLISWRGVWYVVHLGPNPRPAAIGTLDNFHTGAGAPGPAGGC